MKILYYNGTVYDGSQMAEAFIVEDGRFVFCGSNHETEKYAYDEKTDLKGQFVCASETENGRYNPSITLAYKIANFFGMTIEEVFLFEEEDLK